MRYDAAPVAEGAAKPESDMTFELRTTTAKVIAHWIKASRQAIEDLPRLRDIIDTENALWAGRGRGKPDP